MGEESKDDNGQVSSGNRRDRRSRYKKLQDMVDDYTRHGGSVGDDIATFLVWAKQE